MDKSIFTIQRTVGNQLVPDLLLKVTIPNPDDFMKIEKVSLIGYHEYRKFIIIYFSI